MHRSPLLHLINAISNLYKYFGSTHALCSNRSFTMGSTHPLQGFIFLLANNIWDELPQVIEEEEEEEVDIEAPRRGRSNVQHRTENPRQGHWDNQPYAQDASASDWANIDHNNGWVDNSHERGTENRRKKEQSHNKH